MGLFTQYTYTCKALWGCLMLLPGTLFSFMLDQKTRTPNLTSQRKHNNLKEGGFLKEHCFDTWSIFSPRGQVSALSLLTWHKFDWTCGHTLKFTMLFTMVRILCKFSTSMYKHKKIKIKSHTPYSIKVLIKSLCNTMPPQDTYKPHQDETMKLYVLFTGAMWFLHNFVSSFLCCSQQ